MAAQLPETPEGSPRADFWTDRTVAWYARAVARGDYAQRVLEAVGRELEGCADALDVGAGCGAMALPLARRGLRVTAVEPAPAMAAALRRAAGAEGLHAVTVVEAAWGAVPAVPHDLVLCAHVGHLLDGNSPFLRAADSLARRLVVLVRDAPGVQDDDKFFFRELYPVLLGRPYGHRGHTDDTLAGLRGLGIEPRVTVITYRSDQPFADLAEACDFWMTYLGLSGAAPRAYLERFLGERLLRHGDEWIAPFSKRAAVIAWRPRGPRASAERGSPPTSGP